ncbi:unnamed protein product [Miscanthus lutarioriparius]|uniref:Uncharacterized protein n=1 Tax=Miscanthus lutarioriparius TaxID=422564 RepID=A0A811MXV4_9POAL|nr:unnamed protein product [Miscanthus lutarioriparius]
MCRNYGISEEKYRAFWPEDGWAYKTPPEGSRRGAPSASTIRLFGSRKTIVYDRTSAVLPYGNKNQLTVQSVYHATVALGRTSEDRHKAPVLDEAAKEAIKKLDTHNTHRGKSLQFVLSNCDKLPVLPALELAPVRADSHDREREHSASQTFMDTMAGAFEVMRRTEEDLQRVKDELREE